MEREGKEDGKRSKGRLKEEEMKMGREVKEDEKEKKRKMRKRSKGRLKEEEMKMGREVKEDEKEK